jgi:hypothetical protein
MSSLPFSPLRNSSSNNGPHYLDQGQDQNLDLDLDQDQDQGYNQNLDQDPKQKDKQPNGLVYCGSFSMKKPDLAKRREILNNNKKGDIILEQIKLQKEAALINARLNPSYTVPKNGSTLSSSSNLHIDKPTNRNFILEQQTKINNNKIIKQLEKEHKLAEERKQEDLLIQQKKDKARETTILLQEKERLKKAKEREEAAKLDISKLREERLKRFA